MNCQFHSALAKFRAALLAATLAACPLVAFQTVKGQETAVATLTSGGLNSITIGQNGTFNLTLAVTTNFASVGYTVFYQSNNGQGFFQINSRTFLDPIFAGGGAPPPFPPFPMLLNPTNMFDLGSSVPDPNTTHPAGTFTLQSVNIGALNAPIGTYTIFLDNRSIMTSASAFNDVNMGGQAGPIFTVNVVPEPATVGLLMIGGAVALVAMRRKRRAGV